jgi:2-phospho-L-lactate/phosphoenolpyruvate guanylyltransferase
VNCWALVPIKERAVCKMRLAPILSSRGRLQLVRALLHHVIHTLRNSPGIDHIAVVSAERDDIPTDIVLVAHKRQGINQDLTQALHHVAERGATSTVIVPADLPLLDPADVAALLESMRRSAVAVAPDRHELGTNGLALELPSPLELSFGENSYARHLAETRAHGIEPGLLRRRGFSFDIDNVEDLRCLQAHAPWSAFMKQLTPELHSHAVY